jgi:hypothetical protein
VVANPNAFDFAILAQGPVSTLWDKSHGAGWSSARQNLPSADVIAICNAADTIVSSQHEHEGKVFLHGCRREWSVRRGV